MRIVSVLFLTVSLSIAGCHHRGRPTASGGTFTGNPPCQGGYAPDPVDPTIAQPVNPSLTPPPYPPEIENHNPTTTTSGSIPALPTDNSQIPSQVIVPPPTAKTIKN